MDAACDLFYRLGYARVSVDMIAIASGFTKRTVYYHFESKDLIVATVLEVQHDQILRQIDGWGLEQANDAADICSQIFEKLAQWASQAGWTGSGFSRLTMELADLRMAWHDGFQHLSKAPWYWP